VPKIDALGCPRNAFGEAPAIHAIHDPPRKADEKPRAILARRLIVCWEHDWLQCPLEVLELRSVIDSLEA
jgi:hypothetical protein